MPKILIIHGAGMNMRGKVQTEIFGPMTLPEYDERDPRLRRRTGPRDRDLPFEYRGRGRQQDSTRRTTRASMRRCSTRQRSAAAIRRWSRRSRRSNFRRSRSTSRTRCGAARLPRPPRSARASSPASGCPDIIWRCAACATCWRPRSDPRRHRRHRPVGPNLVNAVQGKSTAIRFTAGHSRTRASAEPFCAEHGIR